MKTKLFYLLPVIISTSFFLHSCDSAEAIVGDIAAEPDERAKVLSELLADDTIRFFTISGIDITTAGAGVNTGQNITLENGGEINGALRLFYSTTGLYTFKYSGDFVDAKALYYTALNNLLGDPSEIGSAFRLNLLDSNNNEPRFNRGQLQAIADSLSAEGAFVYLHPTKNALFVPTDIEYDFVSLSTNRNLIRGEMYGTYTGQARGVLVYFRRPTSDEVSDFNGGIRGITLSHWFPVLPQNDSELTIENFEEGRYELELTNQPTSISE